MRKPRARTTFALAALPALLAAAVGAAPRPRPAEEPHRSPIALALSADGTRLLTANQTSGSVTLVDPNASDDGSAVRAEVTTGEKPAGVAISPDGRLGIVTHWYGYDAAILDIGPDSLKVAGRVAVGPEPRGVVIAPDGRTAYVAVGVSNEVVRVDLGARQVTARIQVGREPRGLALTPDGATLVVGNARGGSVSVIDVATARVVRTQPIDGANLRQVAIDAEGRWAYIANMRNRGFATTRNNIDIGWVLGQRLTRVPLDEPETYQTLSLDPQGKAASDAHGVAVGRDGRYVAVGLGGTHEVMIFRADDGLPWRTNSSRDLIAPELLRGDGRFRRVALGGRPTEITFAPDGRTLYVANYLLDAVQVVDAESATLVRTIPLGGPSEPSLERRGEIVFHDAKHSFNQWYSCNTCHSDGHTNGLDFDTLNDGWQDRSQTHSRSRKKVPTLRRVAQTGPWTWHGWQESLDDAMIESFTKSMQGPNPPAEDVRALVAYLNTLDYPPNPFRAADGSLSEAARRGEAVYRSSKAACATCHGGPELTDGKVHEVGLGERGDVYKGHNPPSLRGLYDKDPFLHDGRAPDLRVTLTKWHAPEDVTGLGELSEQELSDLIEYLKTL
jgi:YVTN family beta-propeller protein